MRPYLSSIARCGVVSIIATSSLATAPSLAAPIGPINPTLPESSKPLLVEMGEGRDRTNPAYWPRMRGGGWNGGGGHWNGGGGHWNGRGGWNHGGGHWGNGWGGWGPGFALGLGLGLPLGYYGGGVPLGYYGGYDGYYDGYYGRPIYRPRVYRDHAYNNRRYSNNRRYYNNEERRNHCDNQYLTGPSFFRCDR
jgi:hypothetical protein